LGSGTPIGFLNKGVEPLTVLSRNLFHGNSSEYLQYRHNLPPDLLPTVAVAETLARKAAE
jgi:hypothetical protein